MNPRNIFWPMNPKPEPNGVQRLVRVLHWGLSAGAAVGSIVAVTSAQVDGLETLVGSVALFAFGRILRYIMAGE